MSKTINSEQSRTILSGVKPTGRPHLGNFFGAMKQFVELQDKYQDGINYFFIADYHALNLIQNAKELNKLTLDIVIDFLAIGLDPKKSIIFKQSDVQEHTELAWIFDTITTVPYLKRAHAYKDAMTKGGEESISVGLFNYPMLMAADILLYDTDIVPVGQDQKQHIEFARDTAEKFNRIFGETFKLPEPLIIKDVEVVPGTDGRKMSKSYNNTIPLFATDEEIEKSVLSIITDSDGEKPKNVKLSIEIPATEAIAVIEDTPGIGIISTFNLLFKISATSLFPGSEIPGVPASETKAKIFPSRNKLKISSTFFKLVTRRKNLSFSF